MKMRINTNLSALNAYRNLALTDSRLSKSLERLSSGLRINRAADDAAGLAISEKMRGQIRGLNQAMRNAMDGISLMQTAEGALNETHAILQRMRELSVQASSDTLTSSDRIEIQREIEHLVGEMDRVSSSTEFNTKKLLDGSAAALTSTSELHTKIFMRGGLRTIDQFGQKAVGGGNYRLEILASAGHGEVQKTDIMKVKHEVPASAEVETLQNGTPTAGEVLTVDLDGATDGTFDLTLNGNSLTFAYDASDTVIQTEINDNLATLGLTEEVAVTRQGDLITINIAPADETTGIGFDGSALTASVEASFTVTMPYQAETYAATLVPTDVDVAEGFLDQTAIDSDFSYSLSYSESVPAAGNIDATDLQISYNREDAGDANNIVINFTRDSAVSATWTGSTLAVVLVEGEGYGAADIAAIINGAAADAPVEFGGSFTATGDDVLAGSATGSATLLSGVSSRWAAAGEVTQDYIYAEDSPGVYGTGTVELGGTVADLSLLTNMADGSLVIVTATVDTPAQGQEMLLNLNNATGGSFNFELGVDTVTINFDDIDDTYLETQISSLAGISGTVTVADNGNDTYTVTFDPSDEAVVISIEDPQSLIGLASVSMETTPFQPVQNEIQQIVIDNVSEGEFTLAYVTPEARQLSLGDADGGTFELINSDGFSTGPLGYNASAEEIGEALEEIFAVGDVLVSGSAAAGFTITFYNQTAESGLVFKDIDLDNATDPGLDAPPPFESLETGLISVDADADTVRAELEALANIGEGNVQVTLDQAGSWTIEFVNDLAGTPVNELNLNEENLGIVAIGSIATRSSAIFDVDRFWDANGNFLVQDPQTINLVQGDGKKTSITIFGSDTIADIESKLNRAIHEGLDQSAFNPVADSYVTYVTPQIAAEAAETGGKFTVAGTFVIQSAVTGNDGEIRFSGDEGVINALSLTTLQQSKENEFTVNVKDAHSGEVIAGNTRIVGNLLVGVVHENVDVKFNPMAGIYVELAEDDRSFNWESSLEAERIFIHLSDSTMVFHIGANPLQDVSGAIGDMGSESLGVDNILVNNRSSANRAISKLDYAITRVSSERAKMGALQNRLEHTINNLGVAAENLSAAESRVRDLDFALEMVEFTRNQIMMQAGTSMLAQANMKPQSVLTLLQ